MKNTKNQNKWEEKENIKQEKKSKKPKEDGKWNIIGETRNDFKKKPENGIIERKKRVGGIYRIKNLINGKMYIGSAIEFKERWGNHKRGLRKNKHCNKYLQRSWNKHGKENFEFKIMRIVEDESMLIPIEQFYLDMYKSYDRKNGYNICKISGNKLGFKHSKKTKIKISLVKKGKKLSKEHIKNLSKPRSDEHKKNISIGKKGKKIKPFSDEHKKNISFAKKGKKLSKEHIKNLSKSHIGKIPWNRGLGKKVFQFDLNGKFIKEWTNTQQIIKDLGFLSNKINDSCTGTIKTSCGFIWLYDKNEINQKLKKINLNYYESYTSGSK